MATDINEELSNIYNQAKMAINDDLKQNFYNAAQARTQAFRQLNNKANAQHALYSGMPAATQMQYDQSTYLPGTATMVTNAIAKQQSNQEQWDNYMEYVNQLNEQADYYNNLANEANSKSGDIKSLQSKLTQTGATQGAAGLSTKPTSSSSGNAYTDFGGGSSW